MLLNRFLVAALLMAPCIALGQSGAKALFNDPTSGVTVQGSVKAPVKATTSPSRTAPVAAASSSVPAGEGEITGLRYWIEVQTEQGQLLRTTSSRVFKSGERMRVHVESNVDGSLVMLQSQDSGPFSKLFPVNGNSGKIEKFKDQVFPSQTGWFRFDNKPGDIRLIMMVQASQTGTPAVLMASAAQPQTSSPGAIRTTPDGEHQLAALVQRQTDLLKGSKALMVEDDSSGKDAATYVISDSRQAPSDVGRGLVAVEVKLAHR